MKQPSMTTNQRDAVLQRDKMCVAAKLDKSHHCRTYSGEAHYPTALRLLEVDHIKDAPGMSVRAPHHMTVAMCQHGNKVEHWGSANRDLCLAYLAGVFAAGWQLPERRAA